jgi:hypothetical protein
VRKEIPMLLTALAALVVILGQYVEYGNTLHLLATLNSWYQVATAVAYPVGMVSLTIVHLHNVRRKRVRWPLSVVVIVASYAYLVGSLVSGSAHGKLMDWVYQAYVSPAGATEYGLIAFIITSVAFRTFRLRSREASFLIVVALFVLVGQSPLGDAIVSGWNHAANWIVTVPSNAAYRAITLGAYLGAFATAIRILLGIERAHIGGLAK